MSSRAMRTLRRRAHPGRDRWLISYADFITLLFAFFTTMYAISTVDARKLSSAAQGFHRAFDTSESGASARVLDGAGLLPIRRGILGDGAPDARAEVLKELGDEIRAGRVELSQDVRGLVVSIPEASAFPTGSAELSSLAERALFGLSRLIGRLPNAVRIEGHSDDIPIHTARFTSNWDLSTARAISVVQFLVERGHVPPDRLSAAGYAEFHPRVPNDSPEARAKNRRVDVVILSAAARVAEEPTLKGPQP